MNQFKVEDVLWLQAIGAINRETARSLLKLKYSKSVALNKEFSHHMNDIEKRINIDGLSIFDKAKTMRKKEKENDQ